MNLVDKKDNLAVALSDFVDYGLQALLKLALVLGSGHQRTHVKRIYLLAFQVFGHVAAHYAVRQPLGYGGLAGAGLAHKHRVVLGTAR